MAAEAGDARGLERLQAELAGFPPTAVTARLLEGLFKVLPGGPPLPPYDSIETAAAAVVGRVPDDVLARALILADHRGTDEALFAARSIDTGDTGLSIVSGVRSALSLFLGADRVQAGIAQQQRTDAALKALALAYLLTRLLPIDPNARVELVRSVPAGQEMLLYYGAIEVALPFSDAVQAAGGTFVRDLVQSHSRAMAQRLLGVVGRQGVADAEEMLAHLTGVLDEAALHCSPHTDALAAQVRSLMPAAVQSGSLTDIVATGADALPCYRYLCARLAAEACLARAKLDHMPDSALPDLLGEGVPVAEVAAPPPLPPHLVAGAPSPRLTDTSVRPAPVPGSLPTTELPEDQRLRGVFVEDGADDPRWLVFTKEGVFATAPPATPAPVDWDALVAHGHTVTTYRRDGETLTIDGPGGPRTVPILRQAYTLTLDDIVYRRADFDLTGRGLEGVWVDPQGHRLVLGADGSAIREGRATTYTLGVAQLRWGHSPKVAESLLSALRPNSRSPDVLWLGAVQHQRAIGPPSDSAG